jgi:hypothetical protein
MGKAALRALSQTSLIDVVRYLKPSRFRNRVLFVVAAQEASRVRASALGEPGSAA